MDTNEPNTKDVYNSALAMVLKLRKTELGLTFEDLEASTGIKVQTLKRLVSDQRSIHMGDFIKLTTALNLDPADAIQSAADRVENTSA